MFESKQEDPRNEKCENTNQHKLNIHVCLGGRGFQFEKASNRTKSTRGGSVLDSAFGADEECESKGTFKVTVHPLQSPKASRLEHRFEARLVPR